MKVNKITLINSVVIFFALFCIMYFSMGIFFQTKMVYSLNVIGVVEETRTGNRDKSAYVIKFKNTDKFNKDIGFLHHDSKVLKIGDSLFKPMFSNHVQVFRKDKTDEYKFIFEIKAR